MKKTVLLILMVSSLFADKVVYQVEKKTKESVLKFNEEVEGEYLGVLDGKTYIRTNNEKLKAINCSDVIVVIDDDEKPIQFDCSESTFIPKTLTELDVKEIKKFYFGGILIAAGGLILYETIDRECDDCETLDDDEHFTDIGIFIQKMGYGFIIVGGILVAMGI